LPADVLDQNPAINAALLDFRQQLREAYDSGKYASWAGTVEFRPREVFEFDSGVHYRRRLTKPTQTR
jgi:hypothetical protein